MAKYRSLKSQSYTKCELAQLDSHSVVGSIPTGGKLFAQINLPFTMKQHKNENIANIDTNTPINVYARFCLSTAKSKFPLISSVAE